MKVKKKKKKKIFFFFFFEFGNFLSQSWEKHLIFALGIGAEIRPQNRPRKIPVTFTDEEGGSQQVLLFKKIYWNY